MKLPESLKATLTILAVIVSFALFIFLTPVLFRLMEMSYEFWFRK